MSSAVFAQRFQSLLDLANWFTLVPGLIGVLLAAPFILDLEHGTYRLAWTQSITRRRWLLGKLGLPVVAALLTARRADPAPHLVARSERPRRRTTRDRQLRQHRAPSSSATPSSRSPWP